MIIKEMRFVKTESIFSKNQTLRALTVAKVVTKIFMFVKLLSIY